MKRYKEYARHIWDEVKFLREEAAGKVDWITCTISSTVKVFSPQITQHLLF